MPAVIDRKTGAILSASQLTEAQKQRMADAIAAAMVQLSRPLIVQAVEDYLSSLQDSQ